MKLKSILFLVLPLICGGLFISCDPEKPAVNPYDIDPIGVLGEIEVASTDVKAGRFFSLACPYTISEGIDASQVKMKWVVGLQSFDVVIKDGKATQSLALNNAGNLTITLRMTFGTKSVEKSIQMHAAPYDVRTSYWGETVEETLYYVKNLKVAEDGKKYMTESEPEIYKSISISDDLGGSASMTMGTRVAYYIFDNTKLSGVEEVCTSSNSKKDILVLFYQRISGLRTYLHYKENQNLGHNLLDGFAPDAATKVVLDKISMKTSLADYSKEDRELIDQLVLEKKIELQFTADNGGSSVVLKSEISDTGECNAHIVYKPL